MENWKISISRHFIEREYSTHHQKSCKENVVSSLFNRPCSIITNVHKESARIKQVLKENVKSLRELRTITACLSHNN